MANWLERAQREIQNSPGRGAANAAERPLTAALAASSPEESGNSRVSNGSNGSTSTKGFPEIERDVLARPDPIPPPPHNAKAELPKPRAPVALDEVLAAACAGVAGITREVFRSLLSPEDLDDIEAGAIHPKTLKAYAQVFAEGLRSGRIAPVEDPVPGISGELIRRGCKGILDDILIELHLAGLELVKDGDNLVVEPKEASTPEWISLIDAHKAELLAEWARSPSSPMPSSKPRARAGSW